MKSREFWQVFTGLTVELLLVSNLFAPPAIAGRYVLNQTPQTIERYFGRPISKQTNGNGVIYIYNPKSFRPIFPQFPKSNFFITFVNNQAKYITLNFNADFSQYPGDHNYGQAEAAKFYNYIFEYQLPIWQELAAKFRGNETVYFYEHCLGDGVATSFEKYGYHQFTNSATLAYDARCEPTYNQDSN